MTGTLEKQSAEFRLTADPEIVHQRIAEARRLRAEALRDLVSRLIAAMPRWRWQVARQA